MTQARNAKQVRHTEYRFTGAVFDELKKLPAYVVPGWFVGEVLGMENTYVQIAPTEKKGLPGRKVRIQSMKVIKAIRGVDWP